MDENTNKKSSMSNVSKRMNKHKQILLLQDLKIKELKLEKARRLAELEKEKQEEATIKVEIDTMCEKNKLLVDYLQAQTTIAQNLEKHCESLEKTEILAKDNLEKRLKYYEENIEKYSNKWESYKKIYEDNDLCRQLQTVKIEKEEINTENEELKNTIEQLEKEIKEEQLKHVEIRNEKIIKFINNIKEINNIKNKINLIKLNNKKTDEEIEPNDDTTMEMDYPQVQNVSELQIPDFCIDLNLPDINNMETTTTSRLEDYTKYYTVERPDTDVVMTNTENIGTQSDNGKKTVAKVNKIKRVKVSEKAEQITTAPCKIQTNKEIQKPKEDVVMEPEEIVDTTEINNIEESTNEALQQEQDTSTENIVVSVCERANPVDEKVQDEQTKNSIQDKKVPIKGKKIQEKLMDNKVNLEKVQGIKENRQQTPKSIKEKNVLEKQVENKIQEKEKKKQADKLIPIKEHSQEKSIQSKKVQDTVKPTETKKVPDLAQVKKAKIGAESTKLSSPSVSDIKRNEPMKVTPKLPNKTSIPTKPILIKGPGSVQKTPRKTTAFGAGNSRNSLIAKELEVNTNKTPKTVRFNLTSTPKNTIKETTNEEFDNVVDDEQLELATIRTESTETSEWLNETRRTGLMNKFNDTPVPNKAFANVFDTNVDQITSIFAGGDNNDTTNTGFTFGASDGVGGCSDTSSIFGGNLFGGDNSSGFMSNNQTNNQPFNMFGDSQTSSSSTAFNFFG